MKVGSTEIAEELILISAISGSRAYGLATESSDTDIKGVFVQSKKDFYGLHTIEQFSNETNDIVFYELKRFFELLSKNNPNIIELLASPKECIQTKHHLFDLIQPEKVLSKLCKQTFVLYAESQLKKAKGLNKKIVNPIEKERKSILDFCFVIIGAKTIPLKKWLDNKQFNQVDCGLSSLSHMKDIFAVFHNSQTKEERFTGIVSSKASNDVQLSSIPKDIAPIAIMSFNKDGYSTYCKKYKEYWDWVEKRNDKRYQNTITNEKNYDTKNMMHVFRLLLMAEDIAKRAEVIVHRPERDFLLGIKNGNFSYNYLLNKAKDKIIEVKTLFDNSSLPEVPDNDYLNSLLFEVRGEFYKSATPKL